MDCLATHITKRAMMIHILAEQPLDQKRYRSFAQRKRENQCNATRKNSLVHVDGQFSSRWRPSYQAASPYLSNFLQRRLCAHRCLPETIRKADVNRNKGRQSKDLARRLLARLRACLRKIAERVDGLHTVAAEQTQSSLGRVRVSHASRNMGKRID